VQASPAELTQESLSAFFLPRSGLGSGGGAGFSGSVLIFFPSLSSIVMVILPF